MSRLAFVFGTICLCSKSRIIIQYRIPQSLSKASDQWVIKSLVDDWAAIHEARGGRFVIIFSLIVPDESDTQGSWTKLKRRWWRQWWPPLEKEHILEQIKHTLPFEQDKQSVEALLSYGLDPITEEHLSQWRQCLMNIFKLDALRADQLHDAICRCLGNQIPKAHGDIRRIITKIPQYVDLST